MGEELTGVKKPEYDVTISKLHPYSLEVKNNADYIFTSYRDLNEIIVSAKAFYKDKTEIKVTWSLIDTWLWWLLLWQQHTDLCMHYSYLENDNGKMAIIQRIDELLGEETEALTRDKEGAPLFMDLDKVLEEVNSIKPPEEGYDPKTCMFANHRTGDANS